MKRPVASLLLGLFLAAQIAFVAMHLIPSVALQGLAQGPQWLPLLPGRARVAVRTGNALILTTGPSRYWRVDLTDATRAAPVRVLRIPQVLPGGTLITVEETRLSGRLAIVGVAGAPSWLDPDGRAAAVYDPSDRALWALVATDPRPRPLGAEDPVAPGALVWSQSGDRLTYLSGHPARLWTWKVGSYAEDLGPVGGRPVAVRANGTTILALAGGIPGLYVPRVARAVPVASARVVSAAPDGREALVTTGGQTYVMDLDTALALALPRTVGTAPDAIWDTTGDVAVLASAAGTPTQIVVASVDTRSMTSLPLPEGVRPAPHPLVALATGRLVMTFERRGSPVTYVMVPGGGI